MTEAISPSSATRSVLDASAAIRALVNLEPRAEAWLRNVVAWPTLIYAEVAHTLLRLHRQQLISLVHARDVLEALYYVETDARPVESLARNAWDVALARKISVYDACYVVLAEALDVPLVTADRRLAAATPNGVLLG